MEKLFGALVERLAGDELRAARACGVSEELSARFNLAYRIMKITTACMLAIAVAMILRAASGEISFITDWGQFVSPLVCAAFLGLISAYFREISEIGRPVYDKQ